MAITKMRNAGQSSFGGDGEDEFRLGQAEFEDTGRQPNSDAQLAEWFWNLGKPLELNTQI